MPGYFQHQIVLDLGNLVLEAIYIHLGKKKINQTIKPTQ